ncbi:MAG: ATP-binding protein [bacterium]
MYARHLTASLRDAMADTPVILIAGARQTGKSTLVQSVAPESGYFTFDDELTLRAARSDPQGFIQSLPRPVVLDEVQLLPEIFRPIKLVIDRDRRPGSFVLTGSANVMLLPRLSETLAGRMEILTLWPLSQGELSGMREGFIDAAFADAPPMLAPSRMSQTELVERVLEGGFPEVVQRTNAPRTRAWFRAYTTSMVQRHVSDIATIDAIEEMPKALSLIAAQATGIANVAKLSQSLAIPHTSMTRYLNLLRAAYLVQSVPGWSGRLNQRVMKANKLTILDSGVLGYMRNATPARMIVDRETFGPLLETFVMMELRKQLGWSDTLAELYYFRTHGGLEADFLIESSDGRVVALEVKAKAAPSARDFRAMEFLRDELGDRFIRGILLYTGEHTLPFGDRIWAMPIDGLWRWGATPSRA